MISQQQYADHSNRYHRSRDSPEVVVHGLEEEFDVGFVQDLFEVRQGDAFRGHADPDQVGGLLVLQVIDDPGLLRHPVPRGAAGPGRLREGLPSVLVPVCRSSCSRSLMLPVSSGSHAAVKTQAARHTASAVALQSKAISRQATLEG